MSANKLVGCFVILSTKRLVVTVAKLAVAAVGHSKAYWSEYFTLFLGRDVFFL